MVFKSCDRTGSGIHCSLVCVFGSLLLILPGLGCGSGGSGLIDSPAGALRLTSTWSGSLDGPFEGISAIAVNRDNRVVAYDPVRKRVHVLDMNQRRLVKEIGHSGLLEDVSAVGTGIADALLVADKNKQRIFEFSPEGQELQGVPHGKGVDTPVDVYCDRDRMLTYVLDRIKSIPPVPTRISVFSADGDSVNVLGSGLLQGASAFCFDHDHGVFVIVDDGARLIHLSRTGELDLETAAGELGFSELADLAVDPRSDLWICGQSSGFSRIARFENGTVTSVMETHYFDGVVQGIVPRFSHLSCSPNGDVYVSDAVNYRLHRFSN